tara:strand:- start:1077 stop:1220 length:144 start_codon:yes stop_codon:yes gene_type:complete
MTYVERAEYELEQLDFWFKINKGLQGTKEWNDNIIRCIDLGETINDL